MAINLYEASPHFIAVSSTRIHAASEQPLIINVNLDQLFSPTIFFSSFLIKIDEDSDDEDGISVTKNKNLPISLI